MLGVYSDVDVDDQHGECVWEVARYRFLESRDAIFGLPIQRLELQPMTRKEFLGRAAVGPIPGRSMGSRKPRGRLRISLCDPFATSNSPDSRDRSVPFHSETHRTDSMVSPNWELKPLRARCIHWTDLRRPARLVPPIPLP
jgi:hypothetical protein